MTNELLHTYDEFLSWLNRRGFLLFGGKYGRVPTLGQLTRSEAWHTRDIETDPWEWKDRLAAERKGACVRVLAGNLTLISLEWFPRFLAAFSPADDVQTQYEDGALDGVTWRMAQLFSKRPVWARHELSAELGASGASKSQIERALRRLQAQLFIAVSGVSQRVGLDGRPIGWPSMEYTLMEAWAEDAWFEEAMQRNPEEERQKIEAWFESAQ